MTILHESHESHHGFQGGTRHGALSIKTMRGGPAAYVSGRSFFRVDDAHLLILNEGQPYEVEVAEGVDSFCVFFDPTFAAAVRRDRHAPRDALDPSDPPARTPELLARTHATDGALGQRMARLRHTMSTGGPTALRADEAAVTLLDALLDLDHTVRAEVERLPWARPAVRAETYRRVHRARDYAEAFLERELDLAELAGVANLSPYHFLRAFRAVVGETPGAYVTRRRLERARHLLRSGRCGVLGASLAVGFDSPTSFAAAYRRQYGHPPSRDTTAQFRRGSPDPAAVP